MEDWGAERARLEKEEERLRLKAANLKQRHGEWSLMAKQELETAADIRAALERVEEERQHKEAYFKAGREAEIEVMALRQRVEELERERDGSVGWRTAKEQQKRAEAAEAKLAEAIAAMERHSRDRAAWQEKWADSEAKLAKVAKAITDLSVEVNDLRIWEALDMHQSSQLAKF